jgi:hypothetical protein
MNLSFNKTARLSFTWMELLCPRTLAQVKHPKRYGIIEEYEAILAAHKDLPENVSKSLSWLRD